jgi:hypothetical protein
VVIVRINSGYGTHKTSRHPQDPVTQMLALRQKICARDVTFFSGLRIIGSNNHNTRHNENS